MRKLLPFALLIPPAFLVALCIASQFGIPLAFDTPSRLLIGAAAWTLLFLIIYGHMRGWRSVRGFLIVFVVGKFAAIFYHEATSDVPIGQVMLKLAGATILAWLMFGFFWPRSLKRDNTPD